MSGTSDRTTGDGSTTSPLAAAWQRLGQVDERTTTTRAFWFGFTFLVLASVSVIAERFTGELIGAMPLVGLAMVAVALGDLVRRTTPTALCRLVGGALAVAVVLVWTTTI